MHQMRLIGFTNTERNEDMLQRITKCTGLPEISSIISELNDRLRDTPAEGDKDDLRQIRRRAYDHRRKLRQKSSLSKGESMPALTQVTSTDKDTVTEAAAFGDFTSKLTRTIGRIDGNALIARASTILMTLAACAFTGWLLWNQALPLYVSSGFRDPVASATGALTLAIGAAILRALGRSPSSLLLCLLVGGYEIFFVVQATYTDERTEAEDRVEQHPQVKLAITAVALAEDYLSETRSRYRNPRDKVYRNGWYRKTVLEPAKERYASATSALSSIQDDVRQIESRAGTAHLKVVYRLALVLLFMLLANKLATTLSPGRERRESPL